MAAKLKKYTVKTPIKGEKGKRYKPGDTIELEDGAPMTEDFLNRGIISDGKRGLNPTSGLEIPRIGTGKQEGSNLVQYTEDPVDNPVTVKRSDVDKEIEAGQTASESTESTSDPAGA
ncbi:hypothetical protein [Alicyclobacillus fastidiosus]|uniref:Uncharacterized protein n=1 Tax=Alicyclobacillus fastidiosus TaxID=392011 RepID=A0ABV5AK97_9BACL|nr:hypothetical protein [Alicyclobacillus fastidiosus]WEH09272.1 hypothetical protein PYS47_21785 [Alicyclobacillus fastidiosus]